MEFIWKSMLTHLLVHSSLDQKKKYYFWLVWYLVWFSFMIHKMKITKKRGKTLADGHIRIKKLSGDPDSATFQENCHRDAQSTASDLRYVCKKKAVIAVF